MNSSTVNFSTSGTSTNSTTQSFVVVNILNLCVYSIHFLFGVPTYAYIIWLIMTGTGSGIASEFFNLNLSVCEIVYTFDSLLSALVSTLPWLSRLKALTWFLMGLGVTGRPLFQCLMCVERYLAVVHPVTFLKYKPLRYRVICCTVVWIITLGSCLCLMFRLVSYASFYLIQFILFLSIQLFCCLAVLRALKQSGPGERGREREEENHKSRAFNLILIITDWFIL
ncbi:chemokine XC receptor 1-like [Pseudorasbora parva]|uniref:chemokine XC receptor 1-like n=1 Tax=Pseudorasbora parva TaxID=51549 RepID=UPI00351E8DD8